MTERDLETFVERAYPRLVATLTLICGSRPASEDAVQEALVRAWERAERGVTIESLDAWVTTVAVNLARSRYRRLRAESRAYARARVGEQASPGGSVESSERAADVRAALARLPRRQREITVLRYFQGFDVREVAATLHISEGTVKSALHKARHTLAGALAAPETETTETTEEQDLVPDR